MDNTKHRRLQELDSSDFEIVKGEPDIRGWDVKNGAGLKIGEVEELIVDAQQKKVRYIVVNLDDKDLKLPDRKVLIPIGLAELHNEDDDVLLPSVTVDQLNVLPPYDKETLDDEMEHKVCTALGRTEERMNTLIHAANEDTKLENTTAQRESPASHTEIETGQMENPVVKPVSQTPPASNTSTSQTNDSTKPANVQQPPLGTAEYYGNFYQHAYFSDYNLYKNRQQEGKPSRASGADEGSEYERGLRLWELRNEDRDVSGDTSAVENRQKEMSDEKRKEMIQSRRKEYEERRTHKKSGSTIIQRINKEGLQEE